MVISYLARIPEKASFCAAAGATIPRREDAVEANTNSEVLFGETSLYLMGRFTDEARDVCAAYYQSKAKRGPPYLALANSTGDLASEPGLHGQMGPIGSFIANPAGLGRGDRKAAMPLERRPQRLLDRFSGMGPPPPALQATVFVRSRGVSAQCGKQEKHHGLLMRRKLERV